MMEVFEKFAAFVFLLIVIGLIAYLTYVPVPDESKQVILILIGVLSGASASAFPKLFGSEDKEKAELKSRLRSLQSAHDTLEAKHQVIEDQFSKLLQSLVKIADDNGLVSNLAAQK